MTKRIFHTEDKSVLAQLFFPKSASLFVEDEMPSSYLNYDAIFFPFRNKVKIESYKKQEFSYIANPDGSMRWVFPSELRSPTFLSFYSVTSLKAKVFVILCKILFALRVHRFFISKAFTLYHKKALLFTEVFDNLSVDGYSIFTGTVGVNRKAIIEFHKKNQVKSFLKVPLDERSASLISHETDQLNLLKSSGLKMFAFPEVYETPQGIQGLLQENLAIKASLRVKEFDFRHARFVKELHAYSKTTPLLNSEMWGLIDSNMDKIANQKTIYLSDVIFDKMKVVYDQLSTNEMVQLSWSHGDFVPWNTFASQDKLFVYDWELAQTYYPALFDVFHYVFQSKILIEQQSFDEILSTINEVVGISDIKDLIQENGLDVREQLAYYLLLNVSNYLSIYKMQEHLHRQVYWLLNTWNEAFDYVLDTPVTSKTHRDIYIDGMFHFLHDQEFKYAVLKIADKDIFNLNESSDIDMLFESSGVDRFIQDQQKFSYLNRINISKKSNLTTLELFFSDQTFLSIDLVTAFKRHYCVYLDASAVLSRKLFDERGFYRLSYVDDLDYMLYFYLLNGDVIPKHYQAYFMNLSSLTQKEVLISLNNSLNESFTSLSQAFENQISLRSKLQSKTRKFKLNSGKNKIQNGLLYLSDTFISMRKNRGYIITLSGVDGAGKTTVLDATKAYVENTLRRKVVLLRHRPSILPILSAYVYGKDEAEQRSASKLPRMGTNTSVLKSLLRFMYYYLDYIVGQWVVLFKYQLRGKVVIYDRYYFDFINDPRRTNIALPKWFIKFGYKFLLKPRLNFFLYAEPEVILARKQELDADTIKVLTEKYMDTFKEFEERYTNSHYVCIESLQLETTLKTIIEHINTLS